MLCISVRLFLSDAGEEDDEIVEGGEVKKFVWWRGDLLVGRSGGSSWLEKRRRKEEVTNISGSNFGDGGFEECRRVYCNSQH